MAITVIYSDANGAVAMETRKNIDTSAATTLTSTDDLIVATGSSPYTITLPTAVGVTGKNYNIKCDLSNGILLTINTTSGQLIDSSTSKTLLKGESLSLMSNGTKWINLSAVPLEGRGAVPLGAIIPIGNSAAWALPSSGQIKDGYALCNGQSFPTGSNSVFFGNIPNLTDNRFLQGSNTIGETGGTTSKATTGITASFNKDIMNTDQNFHDHVIGLPQAPVSGTATDTIGILKTESRYVGGPNGEYPKIIGNVASTGQRFPGYYSTTYNSVVSTVTWQSITVDTTVTQGTISDIRPQYFNVVYLMRVV